MSSLLDPSPIEAEVLFLESTLDALDELVNNYILTVVGDRSQATVLFRDSAHQRLFNILLVDFLKPMSKDLAGAELSVFEALAKVCDSPQLDPTGSDLLRSAVVQLKGWFAACVSVPVYLPSIDVTATITIRRSEFIDICGNIGKHNFTRLTRVTDKLHAILSRNGVEIPVENAVLALDDFYDRFHTDILNYQATTIVELLNDLCWAIHEYLRPVFDDAYRPDRGDPLVYSYVFPGGLDAPLAREWFWSLMNRIRQGPFVAQFTGTRHLKTEH